MRKVHVSAKPKGWVMDRVERCSVIIANAYYIDMQTYVMRVDVILNVVSLSFIGLEFVLSLIAMIYFSRNVG